jgi:hypothetical protein
MELRPNYDTAHEMRAQSYSFRRSFPTSQKTRCFCNRRTMRLKTSGKQLHFILRSRQNCQAPASWVMMRMWGGGGGVGVRCIRIRSTNAQMLTVQCGVSPSRTVRSRGKLCSTLSKKMRLTVDEIWRVACEMLKHVANIVTCFHNGLQRHRPSRRRTKWPSSAKVRHSIHVNVWLSTRLTYPVSRQFKFQLGGFTISFSSHPQMAVSDPVHRTGTFTFQSTPGQIVFILFQQQCPHQPRGQETVRTQRYAKHNFPDRECIASANRAQQSAFWVQHHEIKLMDRQASSLFALVIAGWRMVFRLLEGAASGRLWGPPSPSYMTTAGYICGGTAAGAWRTHKG